MGILDPKKGEKVLDLGCGSGELTHTLQERGCDVLGVDAAPDMIRAARESGVEARVMDGQDLQLERGAYDAVFSNAALHWMAQDPAAVARGAFAALRPGGRFVAEFGGHGNVAAITTALASELRRHGLEPRAVLPWYFPTAKAHSALLTQAGFRVEYIEAVPRPTPLTTDMRGWLDTFASGILSHISEEHRAAAFERVLDSLRPALQDSEGAWTADYVRLRFRAVKPDA